MSISCECEASCARIIRSLGGDARDADARLESECSPQSFLLLCRDQFPLCDILVIVDGARESGKGRR